jgi:hypothetical protein
MATRGERRAQKERNRNRWRRTLAHLWPRARDTLWLERTARKAANHGKLCSCWLCGNARKISGETLQERRASLEGDER